MSRSTPLVAPIRVCRMRRLRTHRRGWSYWNPPKGLRRGQPWCVKCRRKLDWGTTVPLSRRRSARALERRFAIRCLDCMQVYCPRCARAHFVPVFYAHARVMRAIDRAIEKGVRGVRCR